MYYWLRKFRSEEEDAVEDDIQWIQLGRWDRHDAMRTPEDSAVRIHIGCDMVEVRPAFDPRSSSRRRAGAVGLMLIGAAGVKRVYLTCGSTDMRKSIDGLAALVSQSFQLDPFSPALLVFCNRRRDKFKILYWDESGFWLYYRGLEKNEEKP